MTSRRNTLRFIGSLTASAALPRLSQAQTKEKAVYAETEGFHWIVPYVASATDTWGQAGLALDTTVFPTGRNGIDAVLAGQADFGICTDTPFITASLRGLKPVIIAAYAKTSTGNRIIVRSDRVRTAAEFRGKTVATVIGGAGHYLLTRFLSAKGVPAGEVKVINMSPPDMVNALAKGDIDAFAWDTQSGKVAVTRGEGKVAFFDTSDSPKYFWSHCLMIASESVVKTKPEMCSRVARALQTSIDYCNANPAKVVEIVAKRTRTDLPTAKDAIADFQLGMTFDQNLMADMEQQAQWSIDNKFSPKPAADLKAHLRGLIYLDAVRAVRPAAVTIA
jgi:sulfonate transport system substrate-binding protein